MRQDENHLADQDLLRAIDGELPGRRQVSAEAHLARCVKCQARRDRIEQAAGDLASVCQNDPGFNNADRSRARLRSTLDGESVRLAQSWRFRILSGFTVAPRWAVSGLAVAAIALFARVLYPLASLDHQMSAGSFERGALPVASLTPGATWTLSGEELCAAGEVDARPIPPAVRRQVVRAYGMEHLSSDEYELDYLITPELGGATDARNLWPELYASRTWNAHVKDDLERLLPQLVCKGQVDLETAQHEIAADWIAAYKKYFRTAYPLQTRTRRAIDDGRRPALRLVSLSARR